MNSLPSVVPFCNNEAQRPRNWSALWDVFVSPFCAEPKQWKVWIFWFVSFFPVWQSVCCWIQDRGLTVCPSAQRESATERRRPVCPVCPKHRSAAHHWWGTTTVSHSAQSSSRPYSRSCGPLDYIYFHKPSPYYATALHCGMHCAA